MPELGRSIARAVAAITVVAAHTRLGAVATTEPSPATSGPFTGSTSSSFRVLLVIPSSFIAAGPSVFAAVTAPIAGTIVELAVGLGVELVVAGLSSATITYTPGCAR